MAGRRTSVAFALSVCVLAACESPLSTTEVLELSKAEARWAARPFHAYTYELWAACGECPSALQHSTQVSVIDNHVIGVVVLPGDSALPPSELASFTTIDGLFARIRRYQGEDWVRDVTVTFDPQLGYPTSINVFAKSGVMDADYGLFIQNLQPLP